MWAKQSTAATLIVGPILDSAGAEYASAVIGDLSISKNGGTLTALAAAATLTHIANGQYTLVMTTGNLDTLGRLQITCNKSTYQMPPIGLNIVPAMVFDSMVLGTDRFDANVTHVGDTPQTAGDIYASQVAIAGYIDTEVGAIKAKTDQLTFTTANKVDSTAVLDSAARVKLDASQPDYAPATAAALATAYAVIQLTDTDVSAIEARLPSDPADQSAVEAAITAATSPLATSSALSTAAGNISTILGKFTGITLLARWLGALAGKTADTTTRTEINATTAGAGYNETTDSQEAIRDRGDAAWVTGSGGGSGGGTTTIVTLQAAAGISPGVIVGPSEPLVIGDDYLTVMNRSVRINLLDADGDPAEVEYGTYALDDAGISIQMLLAKSGKPSVEALIVGTCTFFPAVGDVPPYLIVEFTKVETAKAIPGPYDMQVEAVWGDGKTVTFAPYGQIQFTRDIGRRT